MNFVTVGPVLAARRQSLVVEGGRALEIGGAEGDVNQRGGRLLDRGSLAVE